MIYDEYAEYTSKYNQELGPGSRILVLMEIGSFWEIYDDGQGSGADMKAVSDVLNIQVSRKNKSIPEISRTNPLMAGFPTLAFDKFIPLLVEAGFCIVLVSQISPPPNPRRGVTQVISKGTYMDPANVGSNTCAAIYIEKSRNGIIGIGMSCVDLSTGHSCIFESFSPSGKSCDLQVPYNGMQKMLAMHMPCEIIVFNTCTSDDINLIKLTCPHAKVIERGPVYDKQVHLLHYQNEVLSRCFQNDTMLSMIEYVNMERYQTCAMPSFIALLVYCRRHSERISSMLRKPTVFGFMNSAKTMDLVCNAAEQLDLAGLEKMMNKCVTAMGRRYFRQRLYNPYVCAEQMMASYDRIELVTTSASASTEVKAILSRVYDVEKLYRRIVLKTIDFNGLGLVHSSLNALKNMSGISDNATLLSIFDSTLDSSCGEFKRGYCENVDRLTDELVSSSCNKDIFERDMNALVQGEKWAMKIECENKADALYVAITTKRFKQFEKQLDAFGFTSRPVSGTSSLTRLSHPKLDAVCMQESVLNGKLKLAKTLALDRFLDTLSLSKYKTNFENVIVYVSQLDFDNTCAHNAMTMGHCKPTCGNNGVSATGIRHPIIEHLVTVPYVPNDVALFESGLLLYGLNAAGKSSLMKAIGLSVIMAQCGMYVAAEAFSISPFDSLFCRISKGDDIYAGASTFMVEMSELRTILQGATRRSLVVADELCAGTEHTSAIAIVASGIESLLDRKAAFVFATHLHELTDICSNAKLAVSHLDVHYDNTLDALVYDRTLRPGQGSKIYGLEVCKSLDMDGEFMANAFKIRNRLYSDPTTTRYNSKEYVKDVCQVCGRGDINIQVHHILEQNSANANGLVGHVDKNSAGNLVSLCDKCHVDVHNGRLQMEHVHTSKGKRLVKKEKTNTDQIQMDARIIQLANAKKMTVEMLYKEMSGSVTRYHIRKILKQQNDG